MCLPVNVCVRECVCVCESDNDTWALFTSLQIKKKKREKSKNMNSSGNKTTEEQVNNLFKSISLNMRVSYKTLT